MSRPKSNLTSAFPAFSQTSTGGTAYPVFPTINDSLAQQTPNAPLALGDRITDKFGFSYCVVRAGAALALGQVCTLLANTTGTVSAGTTTSLVKTNITTTLDEVMIGSFLMINGKGGSAGTVVTKLIKSQVINAGGAKIGANTNFGISINDTRMGRGGADGDLLSFTPTTADDVHIIRPYSVDVAGAGGYPVGVALGTITSGNRTIIQISGLARVLTVGTTDALTDGGVAVTAAAGVVKGPTGAGLTAVEASTIVGISKTANALASRLLPIWLGDLEGRL